MKITFLGTGTSTGVPQIGCNCSVCQSNDLRDKRLRTSIFVEYKGKKILIDCGPDFREQMLRHYPERIDAVLITHEHFDHVGGLDDLRPFCSSVGLPIYAEEYAVKRLIDRLPYCFAPNPYPGIPKFDMRPLSLEQFTFKGIEITPIRLMHLHLPIFGYRIGNMAFLTDLKEIPTSEYAKLEGLELLIINGLRKESHISHQTLQEALEKIELIRPRKAYIIHISHDMGLHAKVEKELPANVSLAYDRLIIDIED